MAELLLLTSEFPPFHGGIATYAHELATACAQAGHAVTVAAPDYDADQSGPDAKQPYQVVRFPGGAASFRRLPARIALLRRLTATKDYDIIHAVDWSFFIPVRMIGTGRKLLTLHGTEIRHMQAPKRRVLLDILRFWRPGWAEWIANSAYTRDQFLAHLPGTANDVRAVPLGVAQSWIDERPEPGQARADFGVEDKLVVLSLGRVVERKGHAVLADALALLPPTLTDKLEWWIVGPMEEEDTAALVRQKAAQLPLTTLMLGGRPGAEVRRRIAAADLMCLPGYVDASGKVEGFGLVFLEAAAYGVPAVATLSGGIPEAVVDGETGLLVPERDVEALARALATMLGDDTLRRQMATAAERRAATMTWPAIAKQTYRF